MSVALKQLCIFMNDKVEDAYIPVVLVAPLGAGSFAFEEMKEYLLTKKHQGYQGRAGSGPVDYIILTIPKLNMSSAILQLFSTIKAVRMRLHFVPFLLLSTVCSFHLLETTLPACW